MIGALSAVMWEKTPRGVVVPTSLTLAAFAVWAFFYIRRNPHIDRRTRGIISWVEVIIAISMVLRAWQAIYPRT